VVWPRASAGEAMVARAHILVKARLGVHTP